MEPNFIVIGIVVAIVIAGIVFVISRKKDDTVTPTPTPVPPPPQINNRGTLTSYYDLPKSGNVYGDYFTVGNRIYVWDDRRWVIAGRI